MLDTVIIAAYFIVVFAIGFWHSRRRACVDEYFLAGQNVGWFAIGASLFATNISSEHFIGLAGSGASTGLAVGCYEWSASFCLLLPCFSCRITCKLACSPCPSSREALQPRLSVVSHGCFDLRLYLHQDIGVALRRRYSDSRNCRLGLYDLSDSPRGGNRHLHGCRRSRSRHLHGPVPGLRPDRRSHRPHSARSR